MLKDKLKELREQKGLSQYELADKIFVSRSTIAKWENGLGMPGKASLESLCDFFEISKEELLKEDDPEIIINNIQKKSKRFSLILLLCSIPLLLYCLICTIIFCVEKYEDSISPQDGKFYSEKYLKKFDLDGLDMICGSNSILFQNTFSAEIESYEVFDNYVNYVYNKLLYSTKISYLSNDRKIYNPHSDFSDIYLIPSGCLYDHIDEIRTNGEAIVYEFYYFNDNTKRENNYYVNFNYVKLSLSGNMFHMYLRKSEIEDDSHIKAYLINEYFDVKKIAINDKNIDDYLECKINDRNTRVTFTPYGTFRFSVSEEATPIPPFQLFVKAKFKFYCEDGIEREIEKLSLLQVFGGSVTIYQNEIENFEYHNYSIESYEILENSYYYDLVKKQE